MKAVSLQGVSLSVDEKMILKEVSFDIEKGGFYAIIGPNGAGKSTLLRLITKLMKPSAGRVMLNGVDLAKMERNEIAENIAAVPASFETTFDFTAYDIVLAARSARKRSRLSLEDYEITHEALVQAGAQMHRDDLYRDLSGGEKQKVLIARAIAQQASILILDEPTANLDVKNQMEIMRLLKRQNKMGKTVISIMHDINLAARFIENYIIIKGGKIEKVGNIHTIFNEELLSQIYETNIVIEKDIHSIPYQMIAEK